MKRYIARRLLAMVPLMFGVSIVIFVVMRVLPGDVAAVIAAAGRNEEASRSEIEAVRQALRLDRPLYEQYWEWISGVVRLDFGKSLLYREPVLPELLSRLPLTVQLGVLATLFGVALGVPVGVVSAVRQDSFAEYVLRSFTIIGLAMPTFWVGVLMVLILSRGFDWLPPLGYVGLLEDPAANLKQLVFPALALGWTLSAMLARMTRSAMLEVLRDDFVRTARAKGLAEPAVILRHALKNALIPVVTLLGFTTSLVVGGTVVIETIFSLPGVGRYLIVALEHRDFPVIQAVVLLITLAIAIVNLLIDLLYGALDPRIRYS